MRLVRVPRLPAWPHWAIAVAALWVVLAGLAKIAAPEGIPCVFRTVTSVPCPGCGFTRGVTAASHGDLARGFAKNPLFVGALPVLLGIAALRLFAGRAPSLRPRRAWLLLALVLVIANWAYVIRAEVGQPRASLGSRPEGSEERGGWGAMSRIGRAAPEPP